MNIVSFLSKAPALSRLYKPAPQRPVATGMLSKQQKVGLSMHPKTAAERVQKAGTSPKACALDARVCARVCACFNKSAPASDVRPSMPQGLASTLPKNLHTAKKACRHVQHSQRNKKVHTVHFSYTNAYLQNTSLQQPSEGHAGGSVCQANQTYGSHVCVDM